jgi:hypothetical protein
MIEISRDIIFYGWIVFNFLLLVNAAVYGLNKDLGKSFFKNLTFIEWLFVIAFLPVFILLFIWWWIGQLKKESYHDNV